MIYREIYPPFVLLLALVAQTDEQPLLFPTRDVVLEVKNETEGIDSGAQEKLFLAREKKERVNEIGHEYYSITDYKQNVVIIVDPGPPLTYTIDKLPDFGNIKYMRTGAVKEIAGQRCTGWQTGEITYNNAEPSGPVTLRDTLCITDDGVTLQSITNRVWRGQHTRDVQEATKIIYGPLDPLQFKIPVGAVRR